MQELEYMNILLDEIVRSLDEMDQALRGILTYSDAMEKLAYAIDMKRVPETWQKVAYPTKRGLASWLINLETRLE